MYPPPEHPAAAEAFERTRELLQGPPKQPPPLPPVAAAAAAAISDSILAVSSRPATAAAAAASIAAFPTSTIANIQIHDHDGTSTSSLSSSSMMQWSNTNYNASTTTTNTTTLSGFLAPMGSVVGLRNVVAHPPTTEDEVLNTSLLTPNRGHHALFRALEELEGIEKQETEWQLQNPQTPLLTTIVTGEHYQNPRQAIDTLEALCKTVPRRVCQHPFKRNDIVWVCRTCQADETCVLCHACFKQSHHEGHDVAFYHAQAGGCCDCGDPDAWDPAGFCPHHGPAAIPQGGFLGPLSASTVHRVQGVVPAIVDWMVQEVAAAAEEGHVRAQIPATPQLRLQEAATMITMPPLADGPRDILPNSRRVIAGADVSFDPAAAGSHKVIRKKRSSMDGGDYDSDSDGSHHSRNKKEDEDANTTAAAAASNNHKYTKAEKLGILARQGGGLFLVLKSDDIHTTHQWVDALRDLLGTSSLYTDSILQKLVRALRQYGQLVVWGTMELLAELSPTQIHLWLDGDRVASGLLGTAMLSRAVLLNSHGLFCSIQTLEELQLEQRAVAILQWLTCLARSCDPLCQTVAESIGPQRHLVPLLKADFKLSSRVTKYWHSLLLTLLAVPTFKSHLAAAYCDTYQMVTAEYARGMGVLERSGYALSVQFLNRVTYVVDLVQRRDLLGKLGASLLQTLQVAAQPRLNPNHFVLTHRRYSPCISDLKCVLNVKGMPRLFASASGTFLQDWLQALGLGQLMDPQIWRDDSQGHVEVEVRGWVGAFNASISLGSLFERLLSWDDADVSPIDDPHSPLSKNLWTCVQLTSHVLKHGLTEWQTKEMVTYRPTPYTASLEPFQRRPASLPFSTVSAKHGSVLAFSALSMSQMTPFSFHLPLHRFVAACLREVCLREHGAQELQSVLHDQLSLEDHNGLFVGLMEFPLLVLTRAAQVRAGLWRRNGNGLNDQVLNYAEPPFCRAMRDADLLLVQFGMLGRTLSQTRDVHRPDSDVGVCFLIHLLLHRLGLFDFCGLAKAPNSDINLYLDEVQQGFYQAEYNSEDAMGDDFLLPWTYSPAKDVSSFLLLLEEFLHTLIILASELPPAPPGDKGGHTDQAKWRLRREVVHRLASGPKTHSELAEVHHVLSHWDNVYLSEEGKLVNPDDATGAALGVVLAEVAGRKISRGKMEPDKWQLKRNVWEEYDPSFFHISLRHHQTAAESRPIPSGTDVNYGVVPKAFCPRPPPAHAAFARLRRDIACDATLLAIAYRSLHMHCRDTKKKKDAVDLRGAMAYNGDDRSETAIARAVHILTLGAYAWLAAKADDKDWRLQGGGSIGSIFFDRSDDDPAPTAKEWVSAALMANPRFQQACDWYDGEETTLQLLRRLAVDGGYVGSFIAQDRAVRAGAAWLCNFAAENNSDARNQVHVKQAEQALNDGEEKKETEIQKRKRMAKEKAMERMKAQAAKFAIMMEAELGDKDENESGKEEMQTEPMTPQRPTRQGSFGSAKSSASSVASASDSDRAGTPFMSPESGQPLFDEMMIPPRLLRSRPQCIICSDDGNAEVRTRDRDEEGHRKSRRRRMDGGNALAFVGYTQASTVMKGGGGPPSTGSIYTATAPLRRFVGAHVALCGHAVHSECWESYLATVSQREERIIGKRDEFRCPLCQRLSNCLVPFIDVGIDWIDSATCLPVSNDYSSVGNAKSESSSEEMSIETVGPNGSLSLNDFLNCTPWWVARHNNTVVWDGQCAFIADSQLKEEPGDSEQKQVLKSPRRRSVRPLRKKDLYAAWNAMMKTPRFVRRKLRPRAESNPDGTSKGGDSSTDVATNHFAVSVDSAGETVVWRRFMDQVSDITYRADGKRLGDENLHNDFGEFRHYIVEKYAYNMANRFAGKEPSDWPSCVFPTTLSDMQRQELSREKLLSKLTMTMQAFTYSVCCEANEAKRLTRKALAANNKSAGIPREENDLKVIFSKFGIDGIACDGKLVLVPRPSSTEDDGTQPFSGRLGRLRYFGLAVMAAAGAVAADLVQLVLQFPLEGRGASNVANPDAEKPHRSPIVYPILYGHVLTHVVAAICASSGRGRARSDSLELVWPVPFSSRGSFVSSEGISLRKNVDSVVEDSEGFLKLGLLARVLQVLLGKMDLQGLDNIPGFETEVLVVKALRGLRLTGDFSSPEGHWRLNCLTLLEMALAQEHNPAQIPEHPHVESVIADRLNEGCNLAADAACSYLAEIGTVLQILLPGVMARYTIESIETTYESMQGNSSFVTMEKLRIFFRLEPLAEMLQSAVIGPVVAYWYEEARRHAKAATLPSDAISGSGSAVAGRLFRTQGFRVFDWPMESCHCSTPINGGGKKSPPPTSEKEEPQDEVGVPMEIDTIQPAGIQTSTSELNNQNAPALVTFNARKSVPLIGGFPLGISAKSSGRPRVARIPTSYTDLYAELGQLLPDSEQTAVCLICGEVLNAGGKGECTRHSYKCGAGTGMFFLLQECAGLIMHNGKAAYIHSPFVDSHGETPQYRGRPLNLDLDRYDHLHEVWSGHSVRQQVVAERGGSRQVIVPDFY